MDEKMIFNDMKVLNEAICLEALKSEAAIIMVEQLEKEIKKVKSSASFNTLILAALGYGLYSLYKKVSKMETQQVTMQSEIDMFDLERGIEQTK